MDSIDITELEKRWRPLTEDERPVAETLLGDVLEEAQLRATREVTDRMMTKVVCGVVKRMMSAGLSSPFGAASTSWTASPYGGTTTWSNPSGDSYFNKSERQILGIGLGRVGYSAIIGGDD